jgi:hypothetical protein
MSVVEQLAHFHDWNVDDFIPLLLADKVAGATNGTHDDDDDDDHGRRLVLGRRPKVGHGHSLLRTGT